MRHDLHRAVLQVFGRMPAGLRRRAVRAIAPSYTVGAMCFVERADGALLLVEHTYRRRWGVPGGLMERGEDPGDAVVREAKEEVDLDVVLVGEPAVVVDPAPQRVDVVFRARPAPGCDPDRARPSSPEIRRVGWFPPGGLPELQHETASAFVALARVRAAGEAERAPLRSLRSS